MIGMQVLVKKDDGSTEANAEAPAGEMRTHEIMLRKGFAAQTLTIDSKLSKSQLRVIVNKIMQGISQESNSATDSFDRLESIANTDSLTTSIGEQ